MKWINRCIPKVDACKVSLSETKLVPAIFRSVCQIIELMLPFTFDVRLQSSLVSSVFGNVRSKLCHSLPFISSFRLDRLSVSLMLCFTFVPLPIFLYLRCTSMCLFVCVVHVFFLIDIKEAHREGSDACMTTPHPFRAVTFSFVLSCLIPCFLN